MWRQSSGEFEEVKRSDLINKDYPTSDEDEDEVEASAEDDAVKNAAKARSPSSAGIKGINGINGGGTTSTHIEAPESVGMGRVRKTSRSQSYASRAARASITALAAGK